MVNTGYEPTGEARIDTQYIAFLDTVITTAGKGRRGSEEIFLLARWLADSTTAGDFIPFDLLQPLLPHNALPSVDTL